MFRISPKISYSEEKIKDINVKIIPKMRKIDISGLIIQVEITPIKATCLIEKAIIGVVKKVAPKDALRLPFNPSGTNGFKNLKITSPHDNIPNKAEYESIKLKVRPSSGNIIKWKENVKHNTPNRSTST